MLDLVFAVLALRALVGSIGRRFWVGVAASCLSIVLFAHITASGLFARRFDELGLSGMGLLTLFGPSALPGQASQVPWSGLVGAHPFLAKVLVSAVSLIPFGILSEREKRRPLREGAELDNALAMRFVGAAMLAVATPVMLALGDLILPTL